MTFQDFIGVAGIDGALDPLEILPSAMLHSRLRHAAVDGQVGQQGRQRRHAAAVGAAPGRAAVAGRIHAVRDRSQRAISTPR